MLTVFNYETPKYLKQNQDKERLDAVMSKIYSREQVQRRIDAIIVSEGGENSSPSYGETLTSPKYRQATIIGCLLSLFQ